MSSDVVHMTDKKEELRRQAALCLKDAERATDPKQRSELIALAETFLRLVRYEPINFGSLLDDGASDEARDPCPWQGKRRSAPPFSTHYYRSTTALAALSVQWSLPDAALVSSQPEPARPLRPADLLPSVRLGGS
jgi:hypothetical protein